MYRRFLNSALTIENLKSRNKYAPEGVRYCNGFCQDYRETTEFSGSGKENLKMICNTCRNLIGLGEKQIKEGKITLEQFKENPQIVYGVDIDVSSARVCKSCKETKPATAFEGTRNFCKACRAIESKKRNEDIETNITDIMKLKNNLKDLENYIKQIPKDKLILIISHFQVGRKASDTKDRMVLNIVEHFKKLQNPLLCTGGCGYILQEEFSMCGGCLKKVEKNKEGNHVQKMVNFEDNLEEYVETLTVIKPEDEYLYNKKQILLIFHALKAGVSGRKKKEELIEMINIALQKREEERKNLTEKKPEVKEVSKELILNGISVLARDSDGYVNATLLCKAGGKRFADWNRTQETQALIKALSCKTHLTTLQLIESKKGNSSKFSSGSWIHPNLAVNLAQWISPEFAIDVNDWIRELLLTGAVRLEKEQNLALQKENKQLQITNKTIEKKHKQILYRRSHYKFRKGACFYIISDRDSASKKYKVGIDDVCINTRLAQHRTSLPDIKLEFLVYTEKNRLLEKSILERYSGKRKPFQNHEWIYDTELSHIISSVKTSIDFHGIKAEIENNLSSYNEKSEEEKDEYERETDIVEPEFDEKVEED